MRKLTRLFYLNSREDNSDYCILAQIYSGVRIEGKGFKRKQLGPLADQTELITWHREIDICPKSKQPCNGLT